MADLTGSYATHSPIISQNTQSILRHRTYYLSGSDAISIPLVKGSRFIIYSVITEGNQISIGFGQEAGTITDSRFEYSQTSGPLDLSNLFRSSPFTQYREPTTNYVYLIIAGTGVITASVTEFKG